MCCLAAVVVIAIAVVADARRGEQQRHTTRVSEYDVLGLYVRRSVVVCGVTALQLMRECICVPTITSKSFVHSSIPMLCVYKLYGFLIIIMSLHFEMNKKKTCFMELRSFAKPFILNSI